MSKTDIRYSIDLADPPPLTKAQRARFEKLRNVKNEDINLSDIPELTEKFWKNAVRKQMFKATKSSTTIRVDNDVLVWLKSYGKGYQTRINMILRAAMLNDKRSK
jgi:uncharacterized protein (DUF4415 family)